MSTKSNTKDGGDTLIVVTFRASKRLRDEYDQAVQQEGRTRSQAIRLHMAQTVADARDDKGELPTRAAA